MARQYTPLEISNIINEVAERYFPGDEQFKKVLNAIVFSESSYDNNKAGDNGNSIGLLQANMAGGRGKGYTVEQLSDPYFNLELGMREIAPAYKQAVDKGLKDGNVAEYVSKVAQRPAARNEKHPNRNYGVSVSEDGKVNIPESGEVLGIGTKQPLTTPTATPTPVPQKPIVQKDVVAVATPTPFQSQNIYETKTKDPYNYQPNENVQRYSKQIQQDYNKIFGGWKSMFGGLMNPKPAFSAEQPQAQQESVVESLNAGFLENLKKTQDYGAKTFGFYGAGGHEGTDYRAAVGTPVKGFEGWIVDYAGQGETYYGNKVVLRNPKTGESVEYAHLKDIGVQKGQVIGKNQVIATTGNSGIRPDGKAQQAHLHVTYYDPAGKRQSVEKYMSGAKKAEGDFALAPAVSNFFQTAKQAVTPKTAYASEKTQQTPQETPYTGKSLGTYQVKPGDTLGNLAKQYRTTVSDFMRQNPQIKNPNLIRAGQPLSVPSAPTETSKGSGYTIRSGDTLTSIAKNLGTTVNDLVRKNGIQNPNMIRAGEKLKI